MTKQEYVPPPRPVTAADWKMLRADGLTLTTFHIGSINTLIVLQDWIRFFGRIVRNVRVVTCTEFPASFSLDEFKSSFPSAELVDLNRKSQSVTEMDSFAVCHAISTAATAWVALVKLDTLPYQSDLAQNWINQAIDAASDRGCWAITAFQTHRCRHVSDLYSETQSFSQNLAICHRDSWCSLFARYGGGLRDRVFGRSNSADDRYGMESAIEIGLAQEGWWNLRLVDRDDLSVFHVNRWGDELLRIRERYQRRDGVRPYFNGEGPLEAPVWTLPPWRRYYGTARPSLLRRARTWVGQVRRRLSRA